MRINYERIVHCVYHHHIGIIVIAALISVGLGYFAAQLRIKADTAVPRPALQVTNLVAGDRRAII